MLDRIYKFTKLIAMLSVTVVMISLSLLLWALRDTAKQITTTVTTVQGVANNVPKQLDNRIGKLQDDLLQKVDTLAAIADSRIGSLELTTNGRIGSIQKDLFDAVGDIRKDVNGQLTVTNASVNTLVSAYAAVPATVGARFDRFTNCDTNGLCWQKEISNTLFAVQTASRDTSSAMMGLNKTLPIMENDLTRISGTFANDLPKITSNFASITDNINHLTKPKWYDRLIGYGLNGVVIYRNLNPITNLTVKGAEVISSQK